MMIQWSFLSLKEVIEHLLPKEEQINNGFALHLSLDSNHSISRKSREWLLYSSPELGMQQVSFQED